MKNFFKKIKKNRELVWVLIAGALATGFYATNLFLNQPEPAVFGLPETLKWVSPQEEGMPDSLYLLMNS